MTIALPWQPRFSPKDILRSRCILRRSPPMKVSSTSTGPPSSPPSLLQLQSRSASRIRCSRNHAVFCVSLRLRAISYELMPFLQLTTSQVAISHLSSGTGESSKMLPVLTLYCFRHSPFMHLKMRRVLRYETRLLSQCGHTGPSGQRIDATKSTHTSGLEK